MSVPRPKSVINGRCQAVYNDSVYVLSSDSFQILPLRQNATWSSSPQGVAVTGSACVAATGTDASQDAFYVIGGTSSDSSFSGLQRYLFASKTWESLTPPTQDMQGRTDHAAVYLPGSSTIVVYAGSQPQSPSALSSQTFEISLSPPYNIKSFTSQAPPGNYPLLMPWDSRSAVMVGGSMTNTEIWVFGSNLGWSRASTKLSQALNPQVRGTLTSTTDGGKVLTTYDLSVSPNVVSQLVLQGAGGTAPDLATTIGIQNLSKRDLTVDDWPEYDGQNAPTTTRSLYGMSQDSQGRVVFTGGDDQVPVNVFDQNSNSWEDNTELFGRSRVTASSSSASSTSQSTSQSSTSARASSTTSRASSTVSSIPTATSSSPPAARDGSSRDNMLKILGITLGVLCGVAILFVLILLLLRCRKQRKNRRREYLDEKADQMSFRDRGASYMQEAGGSTVDVSQIPPSHRFTEQNTSHNSFSMIAAKLGGRGNKNARRTSTESTRNLVPRSTSKNDISRPLELQKNNNPYGAAAGVDANGGPKRSSGWSNYFSSGDQNGVAHADRPSLPPIHTGALVPPLDFSRGNPNERFSRVATGSPSFNHSSEDLARQGGAVTPRGQRAHLSNGSSSDGGYRRSTSADSTNTFSESVFSELSSHYKSRSNSLKADTPTTERRPTLVEIDRDDNTSSPRPPSSTYTASIYAERNSVRRGTGGGSFFMSKGVRDREVLRPSSRHNRIASPSTDMTFPVPPSSSSGDLIQKATKDSERPMTVFPRGVPSAYHADQFNDEENRPGVGTKDVTQPAKAQPAGDTSDMSWFSLGAGNAASRT